ncbi:MAG: single-stranded DNA-binding protein [Bacteroidota bacterium]|nr:single-stranded DNA-binding protein [Bacteroidota bacterium]MDP4232788.1 single-stranded DNA-binding protein [Bacteroidota bacterium]MDP4242531.1 single-stranded DNA-binding protein [Bacteroidota bacterium]MDP4288890.1 single-stranded DNA-binding protein [Bacteroidota bacterium]
MACLKMPEVNHVMIAGNLTKDPAIRKTTNGISVINFCLASNHRYRDASNQWSEDVCYVGVVAWSKLADSCMAKLRKGSAVLVDGELQSRTWHGDDATARTVVEIKAHRIQFLNKQEHPEFAQEFVDLTDDFEIGSPHSEPHSSEPSMESRIAAGFDEGSAEEVLFAEVAEAPIGIEIKLKSKHA